MLISQDRMFPWRKVIQDESGCWLFLPKPQQCLGRLTLQGWAKQVGTREAPVKSRQLATHRQGKIRTISLGLYPSIQTAQLSKSGSVSCNRESTDEPALRASTSVNTQVTSQRRVCLEQGFQLSRSWLS